MGIFCFIVISTLSFSTLESSYTNEIPSITFITYLTASWRESKSTLPLISRIIYCICIDFPIKTMLMARIISSFLNNKPNTLYCLKNKINDIID